jgi:hypothetical protein
VKKCNQCNRRKSFDKFYKRHDSPDGHQYKCKDCIAGYLGARNYEAKYDHIKLTCSTCKIEKSKYDFYPDKRQSTGFRPQCKDCNRNTVLKKKFGITLQQYEDMLQSQNFGCAICQLQWSRSMDIRFHVDHNHSTGTVRGILCSNCNTALGLLKENESIFHRALQYLKERND